MCIAALGGLFRSSLETTDLLKEPGAPFVVSRATNDVQMKFLKMSSADDKEEMTDKISIHAPHAGSDSKNVHF